ncbi:MAG: O-antigen ligase family protein [Armatimonadota bacterium]
MSATGAWFADASRALAIALVLAMPFVAGYMFDQHVLGAAGGALLCALAACVACALGSQRVRAGLGSAAWPLAGFVAWVVVATIGSVYLHATLVSLLQMAGYVALLAIFASLFTDERWRRWTWVAIAAAGALEGVIGLRDWTQTVIFQGDPSWRIFGTMYNPNVLAGYLLVAIPAVAVVLAMAWRDTQDEPERPRLALIGAGFALLITGAALLLTGSRAGLLGAMFGAVVFAIAAPTRIRARWLVVGALALVLLVLIAPPLRNRVVQATTQSHSAMFRWHTWVGTAEMVRERPLLGYGPGTFEHAYPRHARVGFTRMAHQTPLQVAAEAGVPALLLLLAGVTMIGGRLIAGLRGDGAVQCAAGLAALAAVGLHNLADYTWYIPAVGLTLSAAVGLALAASRDRAAPAAPRLPCWIGAALALVAVVACGWGLRAQLLHAQGSAMLASGRPQMAAAPLRRAAELDPLDAQIRHRLAQAVAASPFDGPVRALDLRLQVARLNPLDAGNYVAMAQLYAGLGEEQSALAAAGRAVEVHPNYARAWVVLAQLQESAGLEEQARATWRALEEIYRSPVGQFQAIDEVTDVSWAYAWLALGREAEEQGEFDEAAKYFRRAAELTGSFTRMQRSREELLRQIGTWNEAEVVEAERMQAAAERGLERVEESESE